MAAFRVSLIVLLLPALNLLAGSLGPIAPNTGRAVALLLLAAAWLVIAGHGAVSLRAGWCLRGVAALGALGCIAAIIASPNRNVWLTAFGVHLFCLSALVPRDLEELRRAVGAVAASASVYAVAAVALERIPWFWNHLQSATAAFSAAAGRIAGTGVEQGASTAGVYVLATFGLYTVSRGAGRRGTWPVLTLGGFWLALVLTAQAAAGPILAVKVARFVGGPLASRAGMDPTIGLEAAMAGVFSPILALLAGTIVVALIEPFWNLSAGTDIGNEARAHRGGRRLRRTAVGLVTFGAALAGALGLTTPVYRAATPARPQPRVLFYRDAQDSLRTFTVPTFERFGFVSSGMFGLWPRYLTSWGYEPVMMDPSRPVDSAALSDVDVFVVVNPDRRFGPEAFQAIWSFVRAGGSLLVLGDHTDIQGTMGPLNELLAPVGIRFRFDSAFTPTRWVNACRMFPHPVTEGLDSVNDRLRQSTGASLDIDAGVSPVVAAQWGFSDWGDRGRPDHAFLGDYAYQFHERLGEVVVIAEAEYGEGKVLVFGDTSAFQTHAMPHSSPFGERVFAHLLGDRASVSWPRPAGAIVLALTASLGWWFRRWRGDIPMSLILASAALSVLLYRDLAEAGRAIPPPTGDVAYLDAAHANRFTLGPWEDTSADGFLINLERNGYLPRVLHDGDFDALRSGRLFVSIAPTEPYSEEELDTLRAFMDRGGLVILSVGFEEKAGSAGLLDLIGVNIEGTPLGPVPLEPPVRDASAVGTFLESPHFKEAWPLRSTRGESLESFYSQGAYDIVGFRPMGRGGALVIADSWFLHDKTLETEKAWWKGNIDLIRSILEKLRARGVGA